MQNVELNYKITTTGADGVKKAAETQREFRQETEKSVPALKQQTDAALAAAKAAEQLAAAQRAAAQRSAEQHGLRVQLGGTLKGIHAEIDKYAQKETTAAQQIEQARRRTIAAYRGNTDAVRQLNVAFDRLAQAEGRATAGEARKERLKEYRASVQSVQQLVERSQQSEITGLQRIANERKKFFEEHGKNLNKEGRQQANQAFDRLSNQEMSHFGPLLQNAVAAPFQSAQQTALSFLSTLGPVGIGLGVVATAAGLAGKAVVDLVKAQSDAAEANANMALRLGVSAETMEQLSSIATATNVNIGVLERSAGILAQALDDPAGAGKEVIKTLGELKLSIYEASGALKEPGPLLQEVLEALSDTSSASLRMVAAQKLLGRGGKELLPMIEGFREARAEAIAAGVGIDAGLNKELAKADKAFDDLGRTWDQTKKKLAAAAAPVVIEYVLKPIQAFLNDPAETDSEGTGQPFGKALNAANRVQRAKDAANQSALRDQPRLDRLKAAAQADAARNRAADGKTKEGMEDELATLKKRQSELRAARNSEGVTDPEARAKNNTEFNANAARLKQLDSMLKAATDTGEKLKAIDKELRGRRLAVEDDELSAIDKLIAKHKELAIQMKQDKATPAQKKEAEAINALEIAAEKRRQARELSAIRLGVGVAAAGINFDPTGGEKDTIQRQYQAQLKLNEATFVGEQLTKANAEAEASKVKALLALLKQQLDAKRQISQNDKLGAARDTSDVIQARLQISADPARAKTPEDELAQARAVQLEKIRLAEQEFSIRDGAMDDAVNKELRINAIRAAAKEYALATTAIESKAAEKVASRRAETAKTEIDRAVTLAELTGDPLDQESTIAKIQAIKIRGIEEEYQRTGDLYAYKRALDEAEFDRTRRLLELKRKQLEEFREGAGRVFDSLFDGDGPGAGFQKLLQGFGKTLGRTIFQNLAQLASGGLEKALPKIPGQTGEIDPATGQPKKTILGKILSGTPFGVKEDPNLPLKTATSLNTLETKMNTLGLRNVTLALEAMAKAVQNPAAVAAELGVVPGLDSEAVGAAADKANSTAAELAQAKWNPLATIGQAAGMIPGLAPIAAIAGVVGGIRLGGGQPAKTQRGSGETDTEGSGTPGTEETDKQGSGEGAHKARGGIAGPLFDGDAKRGARINSGLATGAAVVGGVLLAKDGIQRGGAKGYTQAAAGGLMAAAPFDPTGITAAAAAITGIIASFLPDKKADRLKEIDKNIEGARKAAEPYTQDGMEVVMDSATGSEVSYDKRDALRVHAGSKPRLSEYQKLVGYRDEDEYGGPGKKGDPLYRQARRLAYGPAGMPGAASETGSGAFGSPDLGFGGGMDWLNALTASGGGMNLPMAAFGPRPPQTLRTAQPPPQQVFNVHLPVSAMDSQDVLRRSGTIADAVVKALQSTHRLRGDIMSVVSPK